jgi:maltose O-acetyltransferase
VQPPFACDYGHSVLVGDNAFINFNAVILDCAPVTIGDGTQIASGVQLLASDHPARPRPSARSHRARPSRFDRIERLDRRGGDRVARGLRGG